LLLKCDYNILWLFKEKFCKTKSLSLFRSKVTRLRLKI